MPAKKDLARNLSDQVKNLKVKTREELSQNTQAEVIKITLPTSAVTTTPPVTMSAPATAQVTTAPLSMDTTEHTTSMEDLIERLISTHMTGTTTSQGIPDMTYQVSCENEAHKVTPDMTKGFFTIKGTGELHL